MLKWNVSKPIAHDISFLADRLDGCQYLIQIFLWTSSFLNGFIINHQIIKHRLFSSDYNDLSLLAFVNLVLLVREVMQVHTRLHIVAWCIVQVLCTFFVGGAFS